MGVKVLFVCHRLPYPPKFGGQVRAFNMIQHLARDHDVTVASLARSDEEEEDGKGLADHCHDCIVERISPSVAAGRMIMRLPTAIPSSMGYFYSPALARRINRAVAKTRYDLIVVHSSSVAQYVEDFRDIPKIIDFADMDSQKWLIYAKVRGFPLSLGYWLEGVKLRQEEAEIARKFDYCTLTTEAEQETLEAYGVDTPVGWFPNGVDLEFFAPTADPYTPDKMCFIGRMDYYPNQQAMFWFCDEVLPLIRTQRPQATLTIVGADPSPKVVALGELPGVTVTGTVPEVKPHVLSSAVNVAPLLIARGVQNKILESMAMGVPVVASVLAAKGTDAVPGEHLLAADSAQDFATSCLSLMADPALRDRFAKAGRARMESHHSWPAAMAKMDAIVDDCLARRRDRTASAA